MKFWTIGCYKIKRPTRKAHRLVRVFRLELVVEPGQRLDEDVDTLVAELVPAGREEVQAFVLEKIQQKTRNIILSHRQSLATRPLR